MQKKDYIRGGYITSWSEHRPEHNYEPRLCTHLFFAFATIDPDGSINALDVNKYQAVNRLKETDHELKTLLSVGGWGADGREKEKFQKMVSSSTSQKKFVESSLACAVRYGFDGLDIDWEHPGASDRASFIALFKELRAVASKNFLLTAAVPATQNEIRLGYDIKSLAGIVDFVNLMAYDLHGSWNNKTGLHSALHSMDGINVALSAKIWLDGGMPKEKIVIGIPAYGRGWRLQSESHASNVGSPASAIPEHCTYREVRSTNMLSMVQLCEKLTDNNVRRTFHQMEQCPSLVCNGEWYGYDDKESVSRKMEWLKAEGYAGAFIWSMDQDDYDGKYSNGEQYPLMKMIKNKLG